MNSIAMVAWPEDRLGRVSTVCGAVFVVAVLAAALCTDRWPAVATVCAAAGASFGAAAAMKRTDRWLAESTIDAEVRKLIPWVLPLSTAVGAAVPWAASTAGEVLVWLVVLPGLLWSAAIDVVTSRIPTPLIRWTSVACLLAVGASVALGEPGGEVARAVIAGVVSTAVLFLLAVVSRGSVGMADVRLAFPLGIVLGTVSWTAVAAGLVLPPLLMFPVAAWRLIAARAGRHSTMPAGPYMLAAAALVLAYSVIVQSGGV